MSSEPPSLSVVVIGRNEGERLVKCLKSVRGADYPDEKMELIYVDSDSTDGSMSAAAELGAKVLRNEGTPCTASAGRNVGFRAASHDLIQFLDGDTVLDRSWLQKAVRAIADPTLACVFGKVEEIRPEASIYNFWAHHDWHVSAGPTESCGGIALFRRSALDRAGGFDETLPAGEEPDLCYRIRSEQHMGILCLDEPMVRHDIGMTRFSQYWRRCARTGRAYAEVGGRHAGMRRWRAAGRRNIAHIAVGLVAIVLSFVIWSFWPVAIWLGLIVVAVVRNAMRCRYRVGSLSGALLYSAHHYIAKLPMAVGQCKYWLGWR